MGWGGDGGGGVFMKVMKNVENVGMNRECGESLFMMKNVENVVMFIHESDEEC